MTSPSSTPPIPARISEAFAQFAQHIAAKESIPAPTLHCRVAASERLPDGSVATLWVGTADGVKSRCYHLDVAAADGKSATGIGGCSGPGNYVTLGRSGSLVFGSVGTHPADTVRVTTPHGTATLQLTAGYFLVPPHLSAEHDVRTTVTLLGSTGTVLDQVTDLPAPGRAVPAKP
jgi:type 1 fimbria pilin